MMSSQITFSPPQALLSALTLTFTLVLGGCGACPEAPCARAAQPSDMRHVEVPTPKRPVLEVRGGEHLEGLHPELKRRVRALYERAEKEGILLRLISGYRPYRPKRNPKPGGSLSSWHAFGAAVDVNMHGRKGMKGALEHLSEDLPQWKRVGAIAQELGLTWGYQWGKKEIFHFEWHPGLPEAIRAPTFKRLKRATGGELRGRYQEAWSLFK